MKLDRVVQDHFSSVASRYDRLRPFDAVVLTLCESFPDGLGGPGVDLCCGTGRYFEEISRRTGLGSAVLGLDRNYKMLAEARFKALSIPSSHIMLVRGDCQSLPFRSRSLAWVSMIDALHLVGLGELLREVSRVLQKDGCFLAYTRTKEQNAASLLGRVFPHFAEVETRLLCSQDLYTSLSEQPGLELIEWRSVEHSRRKGAAELIEEIRGLPYSTFALYKPSELQVALKQFCLQLRDSGEDDLRWTEGNTVVVLRRL